MKYFLLIGILLTIFLQGCRRAANVDELCEADRIDVIRQIIKEEKIKNLENRFFIIDSTDSTLYFITYYPNDVQKYNKTNSVTDLNRLFDERDLIEFKNQLNSFDTTLRLHKIIQDRKVHFSSVSDSSNNNGIEYSISYPLFNRNKNALIVFLKYYGGMLCGGEFALIYVKKYGKWIRLSTIWLKIS
jgi:hypothetical protein